MPGFLVWQLPNTAAEPFDNFSVKMPFNSGQLFHYSDLSSDDNQSDSPPRSGSHDGPPVPASSSQKEWSGVNTPLGIPSNIFAPGDPKSDWSLDLSTVGQDPTAFRSTLLMAALHYSWRTGSLQDYENTFLYYKGESIRLVNEWLHSPDGRTSSACMKLIATLSVTESCIGNFPAADAHLDGLLTLLDMKEAERRTSGSSPDDEDQDDEVLQRLILVAHNFARAVKSRLAEGLSRQVDLFDIWQKSFSGLAENLTALRVIPFYFTTSPALRVAREIDVEPAIDALRSITRAMMHRSSRPQTSHHAVYPALASGRSICDSSDSTACSACKGLSALFIAYTEGHIASLSRDTKNNAAADAHIAHVPAAPRSRKLALPSSWVGFATAADFYLNSGLMLWNEGTPEEPRMFRRLLEMLKRDIRQSEEAALRSGRGTRQNMLWFWKVFMGALALQPFVESRHLLQTPPPGDALGAEDLDAADAEWFDSRIRKWSAMAKVEEWSVARNALIGIVYPDTQHEPQAPSRIWRRALKVERRGVLPIDPKLED
ncbi:hypothetical protein GQ53DRAFT_837066 [Thozetella sp. PMI_491]|nr:hypothetical protein GQ53DRAFT_837066 [Thozetella sp. PMI_491]